MRKPFNLLTTLSVLALTACQPRLIIVHTNDTHSHFEPVIVGNGDSILGGVIERAAFIDSIRAAAGNDRVLLVDAGDFSQGTSYFTELDGMLEPEILNDMRYDCVTLGNHEFDNGIDALCARLKILGDTRVVCSNLDLSQFELSDYVKPYALIERGGMKIGFIGLETDISTTVSNAISSVIPVLDNIEVVRKWEKYLYDTEKCDLIILLSHLGYEQDKTLVPLTSRIDLVIGGHSHTFADNIVYVRNSRGRKVGIVTDGCWGLSVGEVKVYR